MDDVAKRDPERFSFWAADAQNFIDCWDPADPISWSILGVVHAQNDLSHVLDALTNHNAAASMHAVEAAIDARRQAIVSLTKALERHPRAGFQ